MKIVRNIFATLCLLAATGSTHARGAAAISDALAAAIERTNQGVVTGARGTVLVVLSASDEVRLANGELHKTGYFLRELTDPLIVLLERGYDVEFATPQGKTPTVDKNSLLPYWYTFPKAFADGERRATAIEVMRRLDVLNGQRPPLALASLTADDPSDATRLVADRYVGMLIPGGHAPMTDLRFDAHLGALLRHFHGHGRPIAALCHGPIALASAGTTGTGGDWVFAGYQITVVSTADEKILESNLLAPLIGSISGRLPEYADQVLADLGAKIVTANFPGAPIVTRDRELITAQNPNGGEGLGKLLIKAMDEYLGRRNPDLPVPGIGRTTLHDLSKASAAELDALYSKGSVDHIPNGDTAGLGLLTAGWSFLNYATTMVWQGKVFARSTDGNSAILVNKIFGTTIPLDAPVDARAYRAASLSDGEATIVLDYGDSQSFWARSIVDEIRRVGPDLYLGRVTVFGVDLGFFALQALE